MRSAFGWWGLWLSWCVGCGSGGMPGSDGAVADHVVRDAMTDTPRGIDGPSDVASDGPACTTNCVSCADLRVIFDSPEMLPRWAGGACAQPGLVCENWGNCVSGKGPRDWDCTCTHGMWSCLIERICLADAGSGDAHADDATDADVDAAAAIDVADDVD